jgi:hypothetical protein
LLKQQGLKNIMVTASVVSKNSPIKSIIKGVDVIIHLPI